ncbi:T9SS type A sorting domain-containing protein [Cryomorpha ignava]|uniref:T9SS type A sorting domain-containing protein n=1 Tax=Cryomorpha ignava TaxID=101383 RepID=A0A7K3WLK3_9FLAO|nr:T9SS type A sorting domain-containing protein [Cryomorpha ignava]NEN22530.1 T9SS type A sorting domain-containing protein [Cryomorpha ignava]
MKLSILILISLFAAQAVVGQDWQPIYLNETLNYQSSASPDEPIGVFASDLSENADSSDVRLTLDTDTLDECDCESICFRLKADFLQSSLAYLSGGVLVFQNPDTFYIHTQANTGDSWVFESDNAGNEIMATVSSATAVEVLGQEDSLKVISLGTDEEIHLSKFHGITKWISSTDTLVLTSIPKRELGSAYLTKAEVYDFNVGDVFCYVTDDKDFTPNEGPSTETTIKYRRILRFEVLNISENDSIREIEFSLSGIRKSFSQYNSGPPNISQSYFTDTVLSIINLSSHENMFELPLNKYWYRGAYINPNEDYWAIGEHDAFFQESEDPFMDPQSAKMVHLNAEMFNDLKMLSFGMKNVDLGFDSETTILELLDIEMYLEANKDFITYCENWQNYEADPYIPGDTLYDLFESYRDDFKMSAEGIGVVVYYGQFMYSIGPIATFKSFLTGYKKGEETYGYVPEIIDLISVGTADLSAPINFSVFPNPATSSIQVALPSSESGQLEIFDISGRVLFTMPLNSERVEMDINQYPPGVYLIRVETQNGIGVKKIVVSR